MVNMTELYAWILGQYPRDSQNDKFLIQPYYYPVDLLDIHPGATKTGQIQIAANADFIILSMNYRCSQNNGDASDTNGDVVPKLQLQITDVGSSMQFASSNVDIATFMGRINEAPYTAPWPRMVSGRSSLSLQATSYAGTDIYAQLTVTFWGLLVQSLGAMGPNDVPQFAYGQIAA